MQSDEEISKDSLDDYYQNINEHSKSFDDDPLRDNTDNKKRKSSGKESKKNSKKRKTGPIPKTSNKKTSNAPGQERSSRPGDHRPTGKKNNDNAQNKSTPFGEKGKPRHPDQPSNPSDTKGDKNSKKTKKTNSQKKSDKKKEEDKKFKFQFEDEALSSSSISTDNEKANKGKKSTGNGYETDEDSLPKHKTQGGTSNKKSNKGKSPKKSLYETDEESDGGSDSSDEDDGDSEIFNQKITKQKLIENLNLQNVINDDSSFENDPEDDENTKEKIEIRTETIPSFFREQFVDKSGDLNYSKLESKSVEIQNHPKMKKILKTHLTTEEEEEAMELDDQGFRYEPCMLPREFYTLHRLRRDTIERRNKELAVNDKSDDEEEMRSRDTHSHAANTAAAKSAADEKNKKTKRQQMELVEKLNDISKDINYISHEQGYDKSRCLACRHGNSNSARMAVGPFNDMLENYKRTRNYKNKIELAFDLADQFEKTIRKPANDTKKFGEEDIPIFTAEQIYLHIRYHTSDPEEWQHSVEEQAMNIRDHIFHNRLFRVPKSKIDSTTSVSGRKAMLNSVQRYGQIDPVSIMVSEKYFRMWDATVKIEERIKKLKPENLRGYDKTSRVKVDDNTPMFNLQRRWHREEKKDDESMWDSIK